MGKYSRWARNVGVVARSVAQASEDIDVVKRQLSEIRSIESGDRALRGICELVSNVFRVLLVLVTFWYASIVIGRFLSVLESGNKDVTLAIYLAVANTLGYLAFMLFSYAALSSGRKVVDDWLADRDLLIAGKRDTLRLTVYKLLVRSFCSMCDVCLPDQLSVDQFADAVIGNVSAITTIMGPVVAILWPQWGSFFKFAAAWHFLSTARERVYGFFSSIRDWWFGANTAKRCAAIASIATPAFISAWLFTRKSRKGGKRKLRVVQKRHQRVYPGMAPVMPVDPSELNFTSNLEQNEFSKTRTFPEYPTFDGFSTVHASLVRINGLYGATAFRCGQNLVTAGHCVGNDPQFGSEKGIPCFNPDDGKVYWAPLEKFFRNPFPQLGGDGIAVCSLPNADYFLTRQSCQLVVPSKQLAHAGSYRLQGQTGHPKWTFSTGPCSVDHPIIWFKSSVEPGSSGGPIINTDGSVVGVVVAHTTSTNVGMVMTDEVVSFLTKPGGAVRSQLDDTCHDQSTDEFSSTESLSESCFSEDEMCQDDGDGQTPAKPKKGKKSKSSSGPIQKEGKSKKRAEYARRKKKPGKPTQPEPGAPVEYNNHLSPPLAQQASTSH